MINKSSFKLPYVLLLFAAFSLIIFKLNSSTDVEISDELKTQIGQMLLVGFRGTELSADDQIIQNIKELGIGGVILFDYDVATKSPIRNIVDRDQVRALTTALNAAATIPLLISIDQEGGKVARLKQKHGFPPTVSAQYLGDLNNIDSTTAYAVSIASTLQDLNINLNFAPVVDLNINPDNPIIGKKERSYSANPQVVVAHSSVMIRICASHGVLSALKHFPGHGSSKSDSHKGIADVTATWTDQELIPYKEIIEAGQCDFVMISHVFNANLDDSAPASLSKNVITNILRNDLNFTGVVVSDDMQMHAITNFYSLETSIEKAINAGTDILAFGNNLAYDPDIAQKAFDIIVDHVKKGRITPGRITESFERIMAVKSKLHRPR